MFLDEIILRFTHKCSLIKRSLVRFADQPVPKAFLSFKLCGSTVNAVCTFCIRFVSVHSIWADLPHRINSSPSAITPCHVLISKIFAHAY